MIIKSHPASFRTGTRVLMLKGRHKDAAHDQRCILRITHSEEQFNKALDELAVMAAAGERIYGSVGERSMPAAIREFKRKQLDADYDDDPERFYRGIEARWTSALMQPTSQAKKFWLFDCDDHDQFTMVEAELKAWYPSDGFSYAYSSKSGYHVVVTPFHRSLISDAARALIHENPIMLWAWKEST